MNIKETKFWKFLRKIKSDFQKKKNYKNALKMKECDYENYLISRYSEFMNKYEYTKGKTLSLDNPITFSEKSQWLKLYDQDPRKPIFSDKHKVRKYIQDILGEQYLVPVISIDNKDFFDKINDLKFEQLPKSFVIKCNHGSHMNIVVKDKDKLTNRDKRHIKKQLKKWLKTDYTFVVSLETQYAGIKRGFYIEEFIDDFDSRDYKFLCFDGKCNYFWINEDATLKDGTTTVFDTKTLEKAPFNMNLGFKHDIKNKDLPLNIKEMINIAEKLSNDFAFVRVDLFNIKGKIIFGELTFNSAAGYDVPYPVEYDKILGNYLKIDKRKRNNSFKYRKIKNKNE